MGEERERRRTHLFPSLVEWHKVVRTDACEGKRGKNISLQRETYTLHVCMALHMSPSKILVCLLTRETERGRERERE